MTALHPLQRPAALHPLHLQRPAVLNPLHLQRPAAPTPTPASSGASATPAPAGLRPLQLQRRSGQVCSVYWKLKDKMGRYKIEEKQRFQDIFEPLRLPPLLQVLKNRHFYGDSYPSWMVSRPAEGNLMNLTMLNLYNFMSWLYLPPLGQLPCLRFLKVESASAVRTIGSEFLGCGVRKGHPPGLAFFSEAGAANVA